MQYQYSSRRNPCPCCGRNVDSDCRWNDEVMFCHVGSRFAPPSHLKVGETLIVNGLEWALVAVNKGHIRSKNLKKTNFLGLLLVL